MQNTQDTVQQVPEFSREQYDWLEKVFPELTKTTDTNALIKNAGVREVVLYIKSKTRLKSTLGG